MAGVGRYSVTLEQTAVEGTPGEAIGTVHTAATTRRCEVFYMAFSAGGTMADQVQRVQVQRVTALGTEGAGVVPAPLDGAAPASTFDGGEDHSVEPTYTAATEFWDQDVHVRATPQIQLQPDAWIMLPATASAGLGIRSFSANYTGNAHATVHFVE
jgi:hypothetical protein